MPKIEISGRGPLGMNGRRASEGEFSSSSSPLSAEDLKNQAWKLGRTLLGAPMSPVTKQAAAWTPLSPEEFQKIEPADNWNFQKIGRHFDSAREIDQFLDESGITKLQFGNKTLGQWIKESDGFTKVKAESIVAYFAENRKYPVVKPANASPMTLQMAVKEFVEQHASAYQEIKFYDRLFALSETVPFENGAGIILAKRTTEIWRNVYHSYRNVAQALVTNIPVNKNEARAILMAKLMFINKTTDPEMAQNMFLSKIKETIKDNTEATWDRITIKANNELREWFQPETQLASAPPIVFSPAPAPEPPSIPEGYSEEEKRAMQAYKDYHTGVMQEMTAILLDYERFNFHPKFPAFRANVKERIKNEGKILQALMEEEAKRPPEKKYYSTPLGLTSHEVALAQIKTAAQESAIDKDLLQMREQELKPLPAAVAAIPPPPPPTPAPPPAPKIAEVPSTVSPAADNPLAILETKLNGARDKQDEARKKKDAASRELQKAEHALNIVRAGAATPDTNVLELQTNIAAARAEFESAKQASQLENSRVAFLEGEIEKLKGKPTPPTAPQNISPNSDNLVGMLEAELRTTQDPRHRAILQHDIEKLKNGMLIITEVEKFAATSSVTAAAPPPPPAPVIVQPKAEPVLAPVAAKAAVTLPPAPAPIPAPSPATIKVAVQAPPPPPPLPPAKPAEIVHPPSRSSPSLITWELGVGRILGTQTSQTPLTMVGRSFSAEAREYHIRSLQFTPPVTSHEEAHGFALGTVGSWHLLANQNIDSYWKGLIMQMGVDAGWLSGELFLQGAVGVALSLRDTFQWDANVDLSPHTHLLEWGSHPLFGEYRKAGLPQIGGCLRYENIQVCVDYQSWSKSLEVETGKQTQEFNSFLFSLKYFLK